MQQFCKETTGIQNTVCTSPSEELKTVPKCVPVKISKKKVEILLNTPAAVIFTHYFVLIILGLTAWALLWCAWGETWEWNGRYFKLALVAVVAWASGQALEGLTTLPPLLAALLVGILARNFNILDMREHTSVDAFLRKIYPVIILGKASLGWDVEYMKSNWALTTRLGMLPWLAEVTAVAVSTHYLLEFPWTWGFLLGSIYASQSCAVVMPSVHRAVGAGARERNWAQLVCTGGGIDTTLSVGVYGIIYSWIFFNTNHVYACVKVALGLFVGILLGITWGSLAGMTPHSRDPYVTELRVLFVLLGGLLANFATTVLGWVGTGAVAVLACNATAATLWARLGWKLNSNPASTAYRIIWSALEPMVFVYTGTFFVIRGNTSLSRTMSLGFAVLVVCMVIRLTISFLVTWNLTLRERLFVCCAWIPKSIVEAVLCPVAINTLLQSGTTDGTEYAEQLMELIIQNILVTTPIGFLLTRHLGPLLLQKPSQTCDAEIGSRRASVQENETVNSK